MCFEINTADIEGPMVSVVDVMEGSWSHRKGIKEGYVIEKLNGTCTERLQPELIPQLMRAVRPLKMEVSRIWDFLEEKGGRTWLGTNTWARVKYK